VKFRASVILHDLQEYAPDLDKQVWACNVSVFCYTIKFWVIVSKPVRAHRCGNSSHTFVGLRSTLKQRKDGKIALGAIERQGSRQGSRLLFPATQTYISNPQKIFLLGQALTSCPSASKILVSRSRLGVNNYSLLMPVYWNDAC